MLEIFGFVVTMSAIWLVAAHGLWPQVHYAKQMSLAQGGLMGIGAYTAALVVMNLGWSWILAVICAGVLTGTVGAALAWISSRATADGYAIVTLGLQLVIVNLIVVAEPVTRGPAGIFFIPPLFRNKWFSLGVVTICGLTAAAILARLPRTEFGRRCRAVGDDALLYDVVGHSTLGIKGLLGGLGAAGAGVAGALLASYLQVLEPQLFSGNRSVALLAIVFLFPGAPIVGVTAACVLFAGLPEILRSVGLAAESAAQWRSALFSALLVVAAFKRSQLPEALPGALPSREE